MRAGSTQRQQTPGEAKQRAIVWACRQGQLGYTGLLKLRADEQEVPDSATNPGTSRFYRAHG
eukprot:8962264-Pyramimonas_sp.AAC.1